MLIECVLEPLYVSAGFSLYLSRRTVLEGWDLEVAFKRMSARIAAAGASIKTVVALLATAMMLHGGTGNNAWAQAPAADPPAADAVVSPVATGPSVEKQLIEEILKGPEFKHYEDRKTWRRKYPAKDSANPDIKIGDGWLEFAQFIAEVIRVMAWVLAIAFIGWLLYYLSRHMGWFKDVMGQRTSYKPDVLFGMDLRAESLPEDILRAARGLLAQCDMRGARRVVRVFPPAG